MPYIKNEERGKYEVSIDEIVSSLGWSQVNGNDFDENRVKGELNYVIYSIIKRYIDREGLKYFRAQDLIGTLECCKQELYRRILAPYEDIKIEECGDV
jgi:hypothetical protein